MSWQAAARAQGQGEVHRDGGLPAAALAALAAPAAVAAVAALAAPAALAGMLEVV